MRLLRTSRSIIVWNFSAITVSKEYACIFTEGISGKSRGKSIVVGCGMTTSPKPISTDIL